MFTAVAALWKIFLVSHVFAQETCRILELVQPEEDNYLENHVIKSFLVDNKDQCEVRCYAEDSCSSFNLGISETRGKFKCELSDSDHFQHPEHLICREGFSYHPSMKLCGTSPCPPAASCVPDIHGKLRCVCPASWTLTESCERDINECKTGSAKCHVNATCNDTIGSYICKCKDNMVGDGLLCVGFKGFPFHWALNGSDPNISLYNGASYRNDGGRTVLHLNGTQRAYAETPALPIRAISFSIMCWIKVLSLPPSGRPVHIYSDWSEPHQFRIFIYEIHKICANLRGPKVYFCCKKIITNEWMHVAFTWRREGREGILYVDEIIQGNPKVPIDRLDLIENDHTVFDIGLKRDSMNGPTFDGYMRDLLVVDKALSGDEVKHLRDIL